MRLHPAPLLLTGIYALAGLFCLLQVVYFPGVEHVDLSSVASEGFLVLLVLYALWFLRGMVCLEAFYGLLMSGFSALLFSFLADLLDEFLLQPEWVTILFEDLLQVVGYSLLIFGMWRWSSRNRELLYQLEVLASRDPLTGLYNRRRFNELLEVELVRADRFNSPLSLIALDLDHFKEINDRHGHEVGDKVLQAVSEALRKSLRSIDQLARVGGEEFEIIAPGSDVDSAAIAAERLRSVLQAIELQADVQVAGSFGVVCWSQGESIDSLRRRADRALYRAKRNGRNRVEVG